MSRMKKSGDPGLAERDREREREAGKTGHSQTGTPRHVSAQNAAATSSTTPAANDGIRGTTGVLLRHQLFFGNQIIILFEKKKKIAIRWTHPKKIFFARVFVTNARLQKFYFQE